MIDMTLLLTLLCLTPLLLVIYAVLRAGAIADERHFRALENVYKTYDMEK